MARYLVTVMGNRLVEVKSLEGDDDEEYLGIEWALSEVKDSYRHSRCADGSYSLAGKEELADFIGCLSTLLGSEALGSFTLPLERD